MAKSITIRQDRSDIPAVAQTVIAQVKHIRLVSASLRRGDAAECISLLNSDAMRPIRFIEAGLKRRLTTDEKAFFNQCPEHCPDTLPQTIVAWAFAMQDTNQSARMLIRKNVTGGNLLPVNDKIAKIAAEYAELADEFEIIAQ